MAHYGYHYYKYKYYTDAIKRTKRWFRYLKGDIRRFLKKCGIIKPHQPTPQELHDVDVSIRCVHSLENVFNHLLTQYNNNRGNMIDTEGDADDLCAASVN